MPHPIVAIVGAPNVGKSTLFNRMLGRRKAIVSDRPGVTRDRIAASCDLYGRQITLVDTGGVVPGPAGELTRRVRGEALKAVAEADLILFVTDARAGLTAIDLEVAGLLRESSKPIVSVANKIDAARLQGLEFELYRLGLGEVVPLSAEQGRGLDELVERVRQILPPARAEVGLPGAPLAIVGRPNVGKSSLFNRIVRTERALVAPEPGTTRDPVDAEFSHLGIVYRLIDTAGIRRRAGSGDDVERVSVLKARQALEEAEIAIAVVDVGAGVQHQDLAILGLLAEARTPAVLAVNKIDLLEGRKGALARHLQEIRQSMYTVHVPIVPVSALTGQGVGELLAVLNRVRLESGRRFSTAELNRALREIVRRKPPPSDGGREVRLYYVTQTGAPPPRFVVFNNGRRVDASYRRYLETRLRSRLGLGATPIHVKFKRRPASR
jgi:GTPase